MSKGLKKTVKREEKKGRNLDWREWLVTASRLEAIAHITVPKREKKGGMTSSLCRPLRTDLLSAGCRRSLGGYLCSWRGRLAMASNLLAMASNLLATAK